MSIKHLHDQATNIANLPSGASIIQRKKIRKYIFMLLRDAIKEEAKDPETLWTITEWIEQEKY